MYYARLYIYIIYTIYSRGASCYLPPPFCDPGSATRLDPRWKNVSSLETNVNKLHCTVIVIEKGAVFTEPKERRYDIPTTKITTANEQN